MARGFAIIALDNPKTPENVGGVLRAAHCYRAAQVNIAGVRSIRGRTNTPPASPPFSRPRKRSPTMADRSFSDATDGRPMPPMGYELMAAGLNDEDARFVARMLRQDGYYLVRIKDIGWPEINAFRGELRRGQDIREDAGAYFARAIMALFGRKPDPVLTHRRAAEAMLAALSPRPADEEGA